jgi:hypothetical protein
MGDIFDRVFGANPECKSRISGSRKGANVTVGGKGAFGCTFVEVANAIEAQGGTATKKEKAPGGLPFTQSAPIVGPDVPELIGDLAPPLKLS